MKYDYKLIIEFIKIKIENILEYAYDLNKEISEIVKNHFLTTTCFHSMSI